MTTVLLNRIATTALICAWLFAICSQRWYSTSSPTFFAYSLLKPRQNAAAVEDAKGQLLQVRKLLDSCHAAYSNLESSQHFLHGPIFNPFLMSTPIAGALLPSG